MLHVLSLISFPHLISVIVLDQDYKLLSSRVSLFLYWAQKFAEVLFTVNCNFAIFDNRKTSNLHLCLITLQIEFLGYKFFNHTSFTFHSIITGFQGCVCEGRYLTLEGPCIISCNIYTFQRDTQCSCIG